MIEEVGSLEIPKASPKWPSSNRGNFGVDLKGVTSRQNPRKKPVVESSSESDGSGNEAEHGVDGGKDSGAVLRYAEEIRGQFADHGIESKQQNTTTTTISWY